MLKTLASKTYLITNSNGDVNIEFISDEIIHVVAVEPESCINNLGIFRLKFDRYLLFNEINNRTSEIIKDDKFISLIIEDNLIKIEL